MPEPYAHAITLRGPDVAGRWRVDHAFLPATGRIAPANGQRRSGRWLSATTSHPTRDKATKAAQSLWRSLRRTAPPATPIKCIGFEPMAVTYERPNRRTGL